MGTLLPLYAPHSVDSLSQRMPYIASADSIAVQSLSLLFHLAATPCINVTPSCREACLATHTNKLSALVTTMVPPHMIACCPPVGPITHEPRSPPLGAARAQVFN